MSLQLIELWSRLQPLFSHNDQGEYPEIEIDNLPPQVLQDIVARILESATEVTTQFILTGTRTAVTASSPSAATRALADGRIVGALSVTLPAMPPIAVYIDAPHSLSFSYSPHDAWSPMAVMALMAWLQDICTLAPDVDVQLHCENTSMELQHVFATTLQNYMRNEAQ